MVGRAPLLPKSYSQKQRPSPCGISVRSNVPGLPTTELYQPAARLRGYSQALFSWKPKPTFERAAPAFQPWRLVAVPPNFEALIDSRFNFCHSMQWRIQYPQDAKRLFCGFVMAYFQRAGHFARVPDASQLWDTLESPIQMAWVIASAYTKQKFRDLFLGLPYHMAAISIAAAPWEPLPIIDPSGQLPLEDLGQVSSTLEHNFYQYIAGHQVSLQHQILQEQYVSEYIMRCYLASTAAQEAQLQENQDNWPRATTYDQYGESVLGAMELSPYCASIHMASPSPDAGWQALPTEEHINGGSTKEFKSSSMTSKHGPRRPTTRRSHRRHKYPRPHQGSRGDVSDEYDSDSNVEGTNKLDGRSKTMLRPTPHRHRPLEYDELESESESGSGGEVCEPPRVEEDKHRKKRIKTQVLDAEKAWDLAAPIPPPQYMDIPPASSTSNPWVPDALDDPEAPL